MKTLTAVQYQIGLVHELEARAMAAGHLTRDGLRLLRAAAACRACETLKGVWVG